MSSPLHDDDDSGRANDPVLRYAPRAVREGRLTPNRRPMSLAEPPLAEPPPPLRGRYLDTGHTFSGDRAVLELQRQLSLDPTEVPQPPSLAHGQPFGKIALRLCGVIGVAGVAAWFVISVSGGKHLVQETAPMVPPPAPIVAGGGEQERAPVVASAPPAVRPAPPAAAPPPPAVAPVPPAVANPERAAANEQLRVALESNTARAAPVAAPPPPPPSLPSKGALRLDDREISALIRRGESFLANGDLASGRLFLRRAAEAGNANAALELATTFDPLTIERFGAVAGEPDAAQARKWYQKAIDLGSDAAARQLARLTQSGQ
jgi:hypothetical protein